MIKTNSPSAGKGVWVDPPVDVMEEARRTGMWPGGSVPVMIVEILVEEDVVPLQ